MPNLYLKSAKMLVAQTSARASLGLIQLKPSELLTIIRGHVIHYSEFLPVKFLQIIFLNINFITFSYQMFKLKNFLL